MQRQTQVCQLPRRESTDCHRGFAESLRLRFHVHRQIICDTVPCVRRYSPAGKSTRSKVTLPIALRWASHDPPLMPGQRSALTAHAHLWY